MCAYLRFGVEMLHDITYIHFTEVGQYNIKEIEQTVATAVTPPRVHNTVRSLGPLVYNALEVFF